jgi:hypothetical protein
LVYCSGPERELVVTCAAQMPAIQGMQAPLERTLLLGRLTFPSWSYQVLSSPFLAKTIRRFPDLSQLELSGTFLTFPSWYYQKFS